MAEININEAHSHGYQRFTDGGSANVMTTFTEGACPLEHADCVGTTIVTQAAIKKNAVATTSGTLGKRIGEINANPGHTHSYTKFNGTDPITGIQVYADSCPFPHSNCHVTSKSNVTNLSTGGSDGGANSGNAQGSGEIELNYAHQHSYSKNLDAAASIQWASCPEGHSNCQKPGDNFFIRTTFTTINFDSARLL